MKKIFKLYNSNASFFNLIDGDNEVQQTKGFALLLSKSNLALENFFKIQKIISKIGVIDWAKIDNVIIDAEKTSKTTNHRADIMIRLYPNKKPFKLIIIEAKSLSKNISAKVAGKQLSEYKSKKAFEELTEFDTKDVLGLTLTKYEVPTNNKWIISLTWEDIIAFLFPLRKEEDILQDYFNFITNIKNAMKFYEKEVYSLPTQDWSNEILNKVYIYGCPNSGQHIIKHRPLFLTFRKSGGGEMEKLYKVEQIIIMNFNDDYQQLIEDNTYSESIRTKIRAYVEFMKEKGNWNNVLPSDEQQVFILSESTIELPHKPKPKSNNSFRSYYELAELLNQNKPILQKK